MKTKAEILEGLNEQQKEAVINYHGKVSLEATPGSGKQICRFRLKDMRRSDAIRAELNGKTGEKPQPESEG